MLSTACPPVAFRTPDPLPGQLPLSAPSPPASPLHLALLPLPLAPLNPLPPSPTSFVAPSLSLVPHPAAYKGSSDLFIDSNVQLALAAAKQVGQKGWEGAGEGCAEGGGVGGLLTGGRDEAARVGKDAVAQEGWVGNGWVDEVGAACCLRICRMAFLLLLRTDMPLQGVPWHCVAWNASILT